MILGLALSFAVVPVLLNAANDQRDRNGGIAEGVCALLVVGAGVYVINDARRSLNPKGVQFFQEGIEFSPPKRRQRFAYEELQLIEVEPLESHPTYDKAIAGAKLALSIAAMNPNRIGYALSGLVAEKVDAFAVVAAPPEPEFRVAIFGGFHKQIEAASVMPGHPRITKIAVHQNCASS